MFTYNISDSTLWIVGAFLLITLVVGLYAGRGIKDIKEYVLGDRRFTTFTLTLTFLATQLGGRAVIGTSSDTFSLGIIGSIASSGFIIQAIIIAFLIAPNIIRFNKCLTIGDLMEKLYGKNIKILTGILTLFYTFFIVAIQFTLLGSICESLLGINKYYGIIIGGTLLGIYSSFGGIKSVTITDVLQFIVLIIVIPLIAFISLNKVGGYKVLFNSLPKEKLEIFTHKKFYYYLTHFLVLSIIPMHLTSPPVVQRMFMAKNSKQLRDQFLTIAGFDPIFMFTVTLIGLCAFVLFPSIEPKNTISHLVINLLPKYLQGFAICGLLALIMSTADSYLHSAGLLFSNDIIKPIFEKNNKKFKINELFLVRITTLFVMCFAIVIALKNYYFMNLILWAMKSTGPILLMPLLLGIIGIKTDKLSFIIGSLTGLTILFISIFILPSSISSLSIPISIIFNGLGFLVTHILQNKGIAWIKKEKNKKEETKLWILKPKEILYSVIDFLPTPRKIFEYSRYQVMKNGSQNILFGIFCCINFTLPYFLWDHSNTDKFNLMTNMRFIGGIMAGLLIVKDQWKEFLKPYFHLFWHITLIFCLPFITTMMFLLTKGSISWLMNTGTSIFFLILLVSSEMFLILAPLGVALGITFYSCYVGPIDMSSMGFDVNYFLVYQIFFSTLIGLLFAYRKQKFNLVRGNIGLNLGESLCHELRNTLYSLSCNQYNRIRINPIIKQGTENIRGKEGYFLPKKLLESILEQTNEAISFDNNTIKVIKTFEKLFKDYKKSLTNPGVHSMKSTVEYTLKELYFLPGQKERIETNLTDDFYAKVPKPAFAFVISNIIRNAFKHGGNRELKVKIKLENHKLIISDDGKGISSSDIEKIFKMHYTTGEKGESTGIGLGFSKIIVNSFHGELWCESEQGKNSYTKFIIQFPEVSASEISNSPFKMIFK